MRLSSSKFYDVFEAALIRTGASDIRLLTSGKDGCLKQAGDLRKLQDARRAPPRNEKFTIEVKIIRAGKGQVRLPHDRFTIVDDELWHWGANVGGTHNEVNAYSRGWPANETGAVDYFNRLWDSAEAPK